MGLSELLSAALRSRSTAPVHPGSQRVWPAILTAAAVAAMTTSGCIFHDDDDHHYDDDGHHDNEPPFEPTPDPTLLTIDTDQIIEAEPGEGAGVFIEYATGGFWRVWTTCDTNYSGQSCQFDVCAAIVNGSSEIRAADGEELEGSDRIELLSDGWTCLLTDTDADTDGMLFETVPGVAVRFEVALDGFFESRYVYWVGDGVLHTGAPTNPVDFVPTTP